MDSIDTITSELVKSMRKTKRRRVAGNYNTLLPSFLSDPRKAGESRYSVPQRHSSSQKGTPLSVVTKTRISASLRKQWQVISPEGEQLIVGNLKSFCKKHGLRYSCMCDVNQGRLKAHQGWKCYKIEGSNELYKKESPLINKAPIGYHTELEKLAITVTIKEKSQDKDSDGYQVVFSGECYGMGNPVGIVALFDLSEKRTAKKLYKTINPGSNWLIIGEHVIDVQSDSITLFPESFQLIDV